MRQHVKDIAIVIWLFFVFQPVSVTATETGFKKVSLIPQWLPQAQFAGYMVALKKGFYRQAGLDLTLMVGGPGKPPFALLGSGEATFCTDWLSNGIEKRAAGQPVVNLAQIIQRSALMLIAKKQSGIERPQNLNHKTIGLWVGQFYLQPMLFFRKYDLNVNIVPNYSSVSLFLKGGVDAISAMWYNEYHTILNSGFNPDDLTLFFFSREGLNFPEDGIYCLEKTFLEDPKLCEEFVRASLEGWLYSFDNQEEAIQIVMKYAKEAHTGTNIAHQRWMLGRMKDLIIPDEDRNSMGKLELADYALVADILKDFRLIDAIPQFEGFYRGWR